VPVRQVEEISYVQIIIVPTLGLLTLLKEMSLDNFTLLPEQKAVLEKRNFSERLLGKINCSVLMTRNREVCSFVKAERRHADTVSDVP